jgi:hypothetical protein
MFCKLGDYLGEDILCISYTSPLLIIRKVKGQRHMLICKPIGLSMLLSPYDDNGPISKTVHATGMEGYLQKFIQNGWRLDVGTSVLNF